MCSEDFFLSDKETKKIDFKTQKIFRRDGVDRKTLDEVFDLSTLHTIEKLISDRVIDYIDFPISSGKEGNIFLAITPNHRPVILKIFRISTATFKHMTEYIIGDPRFVITHRSRRDIIFTWASKEYKNLSKLQSIGILAPKPIKKLNNVLIMQFIGTRRQAAPMLKDTDLTNPKTIFKELIRSIRKMYQQANLVHSDLSPFNVLIHQKRPYIIDLGQGVLLDHPSSDAFLKRDIRSIVSHFKKYDIHEDENNIYNSITRKQVR